MDIINNKTIRSHMYTQQDFTTQHLISFKLAKNLKTLGYLKPREGTVPHEKMGVASRVYNSHGVLRRTYMNYDYNSGYVAACDLFQAQLWLMSKFLIYGLVSPSKTEEGKSFYYAWDVRNKCKLIEDTVLSCNIIEAFERCLLETTEALIRKHKDILND